MKDTYLHIILLAYHFKFDKSFSLLYEYRKFYSTLKKTNGDQLEKHHEQFKDLNLKILKV